MEKHILLLLILVLAIHSNACIAGGIHYSVIGMQSYMWREITFIVEPGYVVYAKLILEAPPVWDMSSPMSMRAEVYATEYPANTSGVYVVLSLETYTENGTVLGLAEHYLGYLNQSRRAISAVIDVYPGVSLADYVDRAGDILVYIEPKIRLITIRGSDWFIHESSAASPFLVYIEKSVHIDAIEVSENAVLVMQGSLLAEVSLSTKHTWDADAGIPPVRLEVYAIEASPTGVDVFVNLYISSNMVSSNYIGTLYKNSYIERNIVVPSDIVRRSCSLTSQLRVRVDLVAYAEDSSLSKTIEFSVNCVAREPRIKLYVREKNITVYSGMAVEVPYTIVNQALSAVLLRAVKVTGLNETVVQELNIAVSPGAEYAGSISLEIDKPGTYQLVLEAKVFILDQYRELTLADTFTVKVVNSLIISTDKTKLKPGEEFEVRINTVLAGVSAYIVIKREDTEGWNVLSRVPVSFPGVSVKLVAPEEPGRYFLKAYTDTGIGSNIIELEVSKPQISIKVSPTTIEADPGSPFSIKVVLSGATIDEVLLEVLRYEDLVGAWVMVPGIVVEKADGSATIELRAPSKQDTYRFKVRVLSGDEVVAESQEIKVVVGNATLAQNATTGMVEGLPAEIIPVQYLFVMIGVIPAFSFLLWRRFRGR